MQFRVHKQSKYIRSQKSIMSQPTATKSKSAAVPAIPSRQKPLCEQRFTPTPPLPRSALRETAGVLFEAYAVLDFAITVSSFIDMIVEWRSNRIASQEVERRFVEHCNKLTLATEKCGFSELGKGYRALHEAVAGATGPLTAPMAEGRKRAFAAMEARREILEGESETMQASHAAIPERAALPDLGDLETAHLLAKRARIQSLQEQTLAATADMAAAQQDLSTAAKARAAENTTKLAAESQRTIASIRAANDGSAASRSGWSRSRNRPQKKEGK